MIKTVLFIAHDCDFLERISETLETLGCVVADVESTDQAAVLLRTCKCHLVLWDVHDAGHQEDPSIVQLLNYIGPEIPVVFIGSEDSRVVQLARASAVHKQVGLLTKPVSINALSETVYATLLPEARRLEG